MILVYMLAGIGALVVLMFVMVVLLMVLLAVKGDERKHQEVEAQKRVEQQATRQEDVIGRFLAELCYRRGLILE